MTSLGVLTLPPEAHRPERVCAAARREEIAVPEATGEG